MTTDELAGTLGRLHLSGTLLLRITTYTSLTAFLALGLAGYLVLRPTPMHYTAAQGPGIALPGILSEAYVLDLATRCLQTRYTFMPSNFAVQQAEAKGCYHPRLHKSFDVVSETEGKRVKQAELSSATVIERRRVVHRQGRTVVVRLDGRRGVSLGEKRLPDQPITAEMALVPFPEGGQGLTVVIYSEDIKPPLGVGE